MSVVVFMILAPAYGTPQPQRAASCYQLPYVNDCAHVLFWTAPPYCLPASLMAMCQGKMAFYSNEIYLPG